MSIDQIPEEWLALPRKRKEAKELGLTHYFNGKPCPKGHINRRFTSSGTCFQCVYESTAKQTKERLEHRRKVVLAMKKTCQQCGAEFTPEFGRGKRSDKALYCSDVCRNDAEKLSKQRWLEENPDKRKEVANAYARKVTEEKGEQWKKNRQRHDQYISQRLKEDDAYRLTHNLRTRLNQALKTRPKSTSVTTLIGCSIQELAKHLEDQFEEGMSWDNWTRDGWHIDHIRPIASFEDPDDPECWHYSNLQPLWGEDNLRKSDTWEE